MAKKRTGQKKTKRTKKTSKKFRATAATGWQLPIVIQYRVNDQLSKITINSEDFVLDRDPQDGVPRIVLNQGWVIFEGVAPHVSTAQVQAAGSETMGDDVRTRNRRKKHKALVAVVTDHVGQETRDVFFLSETESHFKLEPKGSTNLRRVDQLQAFSWNRDGKRWCESFLQKPKLDNRTRIIAFLDSIIAEGCNAPEPGPDRPKKKLPKK